MVESKEEEQDYHGHFYHPYINSGKYREVWKSGYDCGTMVSPSIFSKKIQNLIMLDKVLVINKKSIYYEQESSERNTASYSGTCKW